MSYRILTKNSVDNTNIDGARQNHFNAGMRSGVVKGALNECNVTSPASNQIVINTGELRISGHQVVIEESEQLQLTNTPQTATNYSIIAEISVNDSSVPSFRIFIQPQNSGLVQDNLFALLNGIGTYQIKLANFTQNTDGSIFNLERVADLISGITKEQIESAIDVASNALSQSNTALSKSNTAIDNSNTAISSSQSAVSTANTANTNANTALSQSSTALETANNALDRVVEGLGTKVSVGGTTQSTIDFTSSPQAQLDNINSQVSTNTSNISSLNTNKANVDLSNVTYPDSVANGVTQTGSGDRVVKSWVSSDGQNWYRQWAGGWKECGSVFSVGSINGGGTNHYLKTTPIKFTRVLTALANTRIQASASGDGAVVSNIGEIVYETNTTTVKIYSRNTQSSGASGVYVEYYVCGY